MRDFMSNLRLSFLIAALFLPTAKNALALDATGFDPLPVPVSVTAQSGEFPVGAIIAWPLASNPADGAWLECNGQAVNATLYPELRAMMANVPDYRGVFLRGYGSQSSYSSAGLGVLQGDAIRNITGSFSFSSGGYVAAASGPFRYSAVGGRGDDENGKRGIDGVDFDLSRVVPTANENRPVNKAVRYLIRAGS